MSSLHTLNRCLQLLHLLGERFHCIRALISIKILLIRKHNLALAGTLMLVAWRLSYALLPIQVLCSLALLCLMLLVTLSTCMIGHSTHVAEELLFGFSKHNLATLMLLLLLCMRRSSSSIGFKFDIDGAQPLRVPSEFSSHYLAFGTCTVLFASDVLEGQVHLGCQ